MNTGWRQAEQEQRAVAGLIAAKEVGSVDDGTKRVYGVKVYLDKGISIVFVS